MKERVTRADEEITTRVIGRNREHNTMGSYNVGQR